MIRLQGGEYQSINIPRFRFHRVKFSVPQSVSVSCCMHHLISTTLSSPSEDNRTPVKQKSNKEKLNSHTMAKI